MSPYLYDSALYERIKGVYDNTVLASPEVAFQESAQFNSGKVKMPLLSLYRTSWRVDLSFYNEAMFRDGKVEQKNQDFTSKRLNAIPIALGYQLDVWGLRRYDVDKLASELVFFFIIQPGLVIEVDGIKVKEAHIFINDISDQTDYTSFTETGRIYRTSFDLQVTNAFIYQVGFDKLIKDIQIDYLDL